MSCAATSDRFHLVELWLVISSFSDMSCAASDTLTMNRSVLPLRNMQVLSLTAPPGTVLRDRLVVVFVHRAHHVEGGCLALARVRVIRERAPYAADELIFRLRADLIRRGGDAHEKIHHVIAGRDEIVLGHLRFAAAGAASDRALFSIWS